MWKVFNILLLINASCLCISQTIKDNQGFSEKILHSKTYEDYISLQHLNQDNLTEAQKRRCQYQMTLLASWFGNYCISNKYYNDNTESIDLDSLILLGYKPISLEIIFNKIVKEHNILILNESHPLPQSRVTLIPVLQLLFDQGFRYIAMETLDERDTSLNLRKYAILNKSGFYTDEPCFGDLVRQSLKIGFKLVAYEDVTMGDKRLEIQAKNIFESIFKTDPDAKVIIYSGHFNGVVRELHPDYGVMGYYLSKLTKTKPIFINQIATYKLEDKSQPMPFGLMLNSKDSVSLWHDINSDVNLFMNISTNCEDFNKNGFLKYGNRNHEVIYNKTPKNPTYPYLIKIYLANESKDAVPIQQVEVLDEKQVIKLMLYEGKYRVECIDRNGLLIQNKYQEVITVKSFKYNQKNRS